MMIVCTGLLRNNSKTGIAIYLSDCQRGAKRERERQRGVKRLTTAQFTNKGR